MMFSSVVLPDPDRPHTRDQLPAADRERHAAKCLHGSVPAAEGAGHPADRDDDLRILSRGARTGPGSRLRVTHA